MTVATARIAARTRGRQTPPLVGLALISTVLVGVALLILPLFGQRAPLSFSGDFANHTALVAAALETMRATHALPISSDAIMPGIEYPYFLFGNPALYVIGAVVSLALDAPAYIGLGITLAVAFATGACSIFALARQGGLNPFLSIALGFLYATGPYNSLNLYVRGAYPEYVAWQVAPALLLTLKHAVRPGAGPWHALAGAFALAAPFYVHKLIAPHLALALAILAWNAAPSPLRPATLARLGAIGLVALLFSVPGWYPALRGLDPTTVTALGGGEPPVALNGSPANLFWPWATDSLRDIPDHSAAHEGLFGFQVGVVPLVGVLAALWTGLTRPRLARSQRLVVPLILLALNVVLILGPARVWDLAPSPLRYLQFTYRLVGLAHLLGFVLLIQSIAAARPPLLDHVPRRRQRLIAAGGIVLATCLSATHWHLPKSTDVASATIRPGDLNDTSAFFPKAVRSTLITDDAITPDQWLVVPPRPMVVPAGTGAPSVILAAAVPPAIFDRDGGPLTVRIWGFARQDPEARLDDLSRALDDLGRSEAAAAPIGALVDRSRAPTSAAVSPSGGGPPFVQVPAVRWSVTRLADTSVAGPIPFRLEAELSDSIAAIAIECDRGGVQPLGNSGGTRTLCIQVDFLAAPNEVDGFIVPWEIPEWRLTRSAFGTTTVDARDLPPGHYRLPTFHYGFVRVTDSDGSPIPAYHFDRRSAIRHDTLRDAFTVSYDFEPEQRALAAALAIFGVYALATTLRRRLKLARPATTWR